MSSALVVGDRGSGLTTFVGLLYAAQLRLGTEEEDGFRFSAERQTIRQLEAIYGELAAGRFPEWDVNWEEHPLSFLLAFRASKLRGIGGRGVGADGRFDTVELQVGGISVEEISEFAVHDAILEESTRRLLRSTMVLPLVDASRLPPAAQGGTTGPIARYDARLVTTLEQVRRCLALEPGRKARTMHPLFVVTKFDRCAPQVLEALRAPPGPPSAWPSGMRDVVGTRILERYLPSTAHFVAEAARDHGSPIASPRWFYSGLQIVPQLNSTPIARRSRIPRGGWEPEYPFEEYRDLIEQLGKLAHGLPRAAASP